MSVERVLITSNASADVILLRFVHEVESGGDDKVDRGTRGENVSHELHAEKRKKKGNKY